jgi:zeta-carotene desaturase
LGLSETYCDNALSFISRNNGNISLSESVIKLTFQDNVIKEIMTSKRVISDFDCVISALPLYALKKVINDNNFLSDFELEYSSILTVHLFLKENRFENTFYGLIDSPVQWVFNKGSHFTVVMSNADKFIDTSKEDTLDLILSELKKYILLDRSEITTYRIIKEKRAAFVPSNNILDKRPPAPTPFKNFFLAGDWTNTGLPATIEGAVKSGRIAAEAVQLL